MKKIIIAVLFVFLFISSAQAANVVNLATLDWEPYVGQRLLNNGFTSDIITEAYKKVGYTVKLHYMPWARCLAQTKKGKYDALYPAYYSKDRSKIYKYSSDFAIGPVMFCALKDKKIKYQKLSDLAPYKIGTVRGYVNTAEFDNAAYLKKEVTKNDLTNLKKLFKGRVDLIVIDKYAAINYLKNNPSLKATPADIKFLKPALDVKKLYLIFSMKKPGFEKKVETFNKGLKMIKEDGTFDTIMEKHGFK